MDFTDCKFLRKIPNVSRIPNLEKVTLDGCENLVEVHHSVGFLEKLVVLSLRKCSNLTSFPKSLKIRSLKFLFLSGCSRLKHFPEIECQMKCLDYVDFRDTGIEELPSSIGNLVRVSYLYLSGCTNLTNLSNSIYQLQDLKYLFLDGCSKVKFLKKVEDNRQSMPSLVSMEEESAISSKVELLQLLPWTNASNSNDGFSSIAFPKLRQLYLGSCALSESIFFRTVDCGSALNVLDLSGSDIVSLPPCIRRFVGLKSLTLKNCKQLREILGLPPNVEHVNASGCVSLAIFLEEFRRSQSGVGMGFPGNNVQTESDFLIQCDCPSSLEYLYLSSSSIVSLPTWFNKFVGLKRLALNDCKQLREISELPPTIGWIDLSNCHELQATVGNDLQIRLLSQVRTSLSHTHTHIYIYILVSECLGLYVLSLISM